MVPSFGDSVGEEDLTLFGETLGQIGEDLLSSKRLREISPDLYNPYEGLSAVGRERLEAALVSALTGASESAPEAPPKKKPALRVDQVLTVVRTYFASKPSKKDEDSFRRDYSTGLEDLPEASFEEIFSRVQTAVSNAKELDAKDFAHEGNKFSEFRELFADIYQQFGKKDSLLFGDADE